MTLFSTIFDEEKSAEVFLINMYILYILLIMPSVYLSAIFYEINPISPITTARIQKKSDPKTTERTAPVEIGFFS